MVCNYLGRSLTGLIIVGFLFILLAGCSSKQKENVDNTFYLELVNFNDDSLRQSVVEKAFGKVSFFKNERLEILSTNYAIEEFDNMHYFKSLGEVGADIKPNTKKIRIEFTGDFSRDSIKYSLQKLIYKNSNWVKTSDMGVITVILSYSRHKQFAYNEYGKRIAYEVVEYSYN